MTEAQASDFVTFDFKGTCVSCVVYGTFEYQINFFLLHNVAKCSRTVIIIILIEYGNISSPYRNTAVTQYFAKIAFF